MVRSPRIMKLHCTILQGRAPAAAAAPCRKLTILELQCPALQAMVMALAADAASLCLPTVHRLLCEDAVL